MKRGVIQVIADKCTNCHRCIAACPVKFCNNGSGDYVTLDENLCIGCGQCIKACPQGARVGLDDSESFFEDLQKKVHMIAIVAPAVAVTFKGRDLELNGFLKSIGVKAVFDVSFGAELTTKSYAEHIKNNNPELTISQPCPAIVRYMEIYQPKFLKYLAPTGSPMDHTMRMIRRYYKQYADCKIAVISPCYAKSYEFEDIGLGDYNVTMKSLEQYFENHNINLSSFPKTPYDNPEAERAVLYSTPGGLLRTAKRYIPAAGKITRRIEGKGVYQYFKNLEAKMENGGKPVYPLVDCLNCEYGCNVGSATTTDKMFLDDVEGYVERRANKQIEYWSGKGVTPRAAQKKLHALIDKYWENGLYPRKYKDQSKNAQKIKIPTQQQIKEIYKDMHKLDDKDILNCGACGYESCQMMASAIFNGINKLENCVHFMNNDARLKEENQRQMLVGTIKKISDSSVEKLKSSEKQMRSMMNVSREMADNMTSSAASIEELIQSINSIKTILEKNAEAVKQLSEATEIGKTNIDNVGKIVSTIEESSKGLQEMSSVIQNISRQTNLLAMNAAIEAAHAGETGKGFAVVADEIRKLAESSGSEAKKIFDVLKKIKALIDSSFSASVSAQKEFGKIVSLSSNVKEQELVISNAITEQSEGGVHLLTAIQKVKELSEDVYSTSQSLNDELEYVKEDLSNLGKE